MVIAFIPVRCGSKSIPFKNIKPLFGKPLVYWNVKALENTPSVDKIIIATDCKKITSAVNQFPFKKVEVYERQAKNATDTASTEDVMLEYIEAVQLNINDTFLLVQATSPFTTEKHFKEGLELFSQNDFDSILSVVRTKRFFWEENGKPLNYNFQNRPRRQDFDGLLMENGAFYINSVKNIKTNKNRLSGKIGYLEMPEYTALEIDEEDDWLIAEILIKKYAPPAPTPKIKLFLCDVDGVLTDAGMYYSESGDELKKFNTRDGKGFELLRNKGIKTGIITSENTQIVTNRAKKLKIDYLYQGKHHGGKLSAAKEICQKEDITLKEVAYIGDDINCFELLSKVGLAACPADALDQIKSIPNIQILSRKGGEGVVREFIELILSD